MSTAGEQPQNADPSRADFVKSRRVEENYREYSRELWALFYADCCDPERAWDAVQQAFLKLQEQNGTSIHDPRAWLVQVGKNWLRDAARRRENAWRKPRLEPWENVASPESDPASLASRADLLGRVRTLMNELKIEDREVLVMRYALGWPSARLAAALGCSVQAVDMRLSRARQRLAGLLNAAEIDLESLD